MTGPVDHDVSDTFATSASAGDSRAERLYAGLRKRVSRQQFTTWFERTKVLDWADRTLELGVPNRFFQEWLQKNFLSIIADEAADVEGAPVRVTFQVLATDPAQAEPDPDAAEHRALDGAAPVVAHGPVGHPPVPPAVPTVGYQPTPFAGSGPDDVPLRLNEHYTFDNFIMGPSNSVAYASAMAVAQKPGRAYNPLFIHGAVGLGKTHLLHAICREFVVNAPQDRICLLSCEEFTNEFVQALGRKDLQSFRDRFRTVNLLVIDDIHFLEGKERTQEEFFHTFNQLYQSNRQIVVSSDAAPAEIPTLEDRLVSRFQWGLVTKLEQPEMETRMAIIRRKAELQNVALGNDVVEYIAKHFRNNIREIEGALLSVQAHSRVLNQPIDLDLTMESLQPVIDEGRTPATIDDVVELVCGYYQVKLSDLRSKKRGRSISEPRQIAMHLIRRVTNLSLDEVGNYFGGRDHSTVLYAVRKVQGRLDTDPRFATLMGRFADRLGSPDSPDA